MVPAAHDGKTTTDSGSDYDFENFKSVLPIDDILINRLRKSTKNNLESEGLAQIVKIFKNGGKDKPSLMNVGDASNGKIKENFEDYEADDRNSILPPETNLKVIKNKIQDAELKQNFKLA